MLIKINQGTLESTEYWTNTHIEINSETHYFINTDDNHNTCNISDEDPRLAKRNSTTED